jgi:hypothetical protein
MTGELLLPILSNCSTSLTRGFVSEGKKGDRKMTIKKMQLFVDPSLPGHRLGRHVFHDSRSWGFPAPMAAQIRSVRHERRVPIFDQGDLGSCTGNAAVGCISTAPFSFKGNETAAVDVYKAATHIDRIKGVYPPEDTGSSGLAVMKVLKSEGRITGYTHGFSLSHALRALTLGPGITGITWLTGCDEPDAKGIVRYEGDVRGGHEVELVGLDTKEKLVWFANSWGKSWGKDGYFAMSFDDFGKALADNGDTTFPSLPQ